MKRKAGFCFLLLVLMTTVLAQTARANNPPGPGESLPEILILPLMALFTAIGGGYAAMKAQNRGRGKKILKGGLIVLAIILSMMHEGLAALVTLAFAAAAITRGVHMILWARTPKSAGESAEARKPRPRLALAGGLLILATVFLAGMSLSFVGYWPNDVPRVAAMKKFIAYETAYSRVEKLKTGEQRIRRFDPKDDDEDYRHVAVPLLDYDGNHERVEYGPDGKSFTIYLLPRAHFPPWPYVYLTSQSSYRGDESGNIRMVQVRERDKICPPDAPVVMKVNEQDIRDLLQEMTTFDGLAFSEGLAPFEKGGKWGYVDLSLNPAIAPDFDEAGPFSEGVAAVRSGKRWGYINAKGIYVVEPKYDQASAFKDGKAEVSIGARKFTVDRTGKPD